MYIASISTLLCYAGVASAFVGPVLTTNASSQSSSASGIAKSDARIQRAGGDLSASTEAPSAPFLSKSSTSLSYRSETVDINNSNSNKREKPSVTASAAVVAPGRKITITETPQPTTTATPVYRQPKITTINSYEEYMDFINEDDRLCVIKFHASWCRTCKKFGMQFKRIGKEIGDVVACNSDGSETLVQEGDIRLAEIEYGANTELCKILGVTKLPSVHFYSQGEKLDGFGCGGAKKLKHMIGQLQYYRSLSKSELLFEAEMNKGKELLSSAEMLPKLHEAATKAASLPDVEPIATATPDISPVSDKPTSMV